MPCGLRWPHQRAAAVSSQGAGSGRYSRTGSARDSPDAPARPPELAGGRDLRHDAAWPQAGGVDILDCLECLLTLRLGDVEDLRAIRRADVVTLAIQRGRIVNLEEELQEVAIADTRRVELDLDGLGVRAMVAIGRVRHIAARVSDPCVDYAGQLADQVLHAQKQPPASTARSSLLVVISPLLGHAAVDASRTPCCASAATSRRSEGVRGVARPFTSRLHRTRRRGSIGRRYGSTRNPPVRVRPRTDLVELTVFRLTLPS